MTTSDPLNQLPAVADMSEDPTAGFKERLLSDLIEQLNAEDGRVADSIPIIELQVEDRTQASGSNPRHLGLGAVAALLVVVGIGLWLGSVRGDRSLMTEGSEENGLPASGEGISYETARALVEGAGGVDGLVVGEIGEQAPWNLVTFDPLDNRRVLLADVEYRFPTTAELWSVDDGVNSQETLPWLDANSPKSGGIFQRDGTIIFNTDASSTTGFPILSNEGNLLARPFTSVHLGLMVSEGERPLIVAASRAECPTNSVQVGGPEVATVLDLERNGFARVAIPETGVAMAFPYHLARDDCDATTSEVARAWDLVTGDPLPDYPLDGMKITHATVSGDGSRALVLNPDGRASTVSMQSGELLGNLTTVDVGEVYNPLALNADGSIAAIATSVGQVSVWHVNSGQLLFEISGDERSVWPGLYFDVGPGLAYDATRAAVLDAAATKWTIYTLDPAEWVGKACANGLVLDQYKDELESLGMKSTC
ncbi:MAG: WD40 repeat domain-containing protein [Acidimicrobiia bacterium]|nr:WD40 repeat domain-containing protein [Acidimicrobiia bacterium]